VPKSGGVRWSGKTHFFCPKDGVFLPVAAGLWRPVVGPVIELLTLKKFIEHQVTHHESIKLGRLSKRGGGNTARDSKHVLPKF